MKIKELDQQDDQSDEVLDRAICAILSVHIPQDPRQRTIDTAATWTPSSLRIHQKRRLHVPVLVACAAALLLIAIALGVTFRDSWNRAPVIEVAAIQKNDDRDNVHQESSPFDAKSRVNTDHSPVGMAAKWTTSIRIGVAQNAPIIVSNGEDKPIKLGASIPQRQAGGALHIWDWSQSPISRVLPNVELWSNQCFALSPDGKLLVWAKGDILDLQTGKRTSIDLGGENTQIGEATYGRISGMQFSPAGDRMAMLVTNMDERQPGHINSEVVQIVEFPSGKLLCEIPPGESYALRIGFSADGKKIVSGDAFRHINLYDATSGKKLRQLEPAVDRQIMGVAISADDIHVAAYEQTHFSNVPAEQKYGDLFIWNTKSGDLVHRIDGDQLQKSGADGPIYGALRFSPDGKHLAAESWLRVLVFDVATGKIASSIKDDIAATLQWSADGATLTTIAPLGASEGGHHLPAGRYDIYPSVHEWDWRSGKLIRSIIAPDPPVKE